MRIVLFGPPGVGKGTQAELLADRYHLIKFSMGDMLRQEVAVNSSVGRRAEPFLKAGHLVPDNIIFDMVNNFLIEYQNQDILFDGFPRNLNQARTLEQSLAQLSQKIDIALELYLPDQEIIKRLENRRYCPSCGRIYNCLTDPPKIKGVCDECGKKLIKREDDQESVIRRRLEVYEQETRPLTEYYKELNVYKKIDASVTKEQIFKKISEIINGYTDKK
ncbi:adenylate kinase [candidate division WOR-3 bacterium 4484_100]|uniref:Adenylate kinase n=1 Tax=candidate division WOR-3 bacterium 4484_100 TaxID=1936077 RepID=A0A1V4QGD1_UNCW3|nr:MAG: adenylate kinase [candidate division WOR-3 bacterium 4484_100]